MAKNWRIKPNVQNRLRNQMNDVDNFSLLELKWGQYKETYGLKMLNCRQKLKKVALLQKDIKHKFSVNKNQFSI